ncbi:MAG: hypothetical protein CMG00_06825 [Candidatus Marinimicrobia bacterium]|nr:hypothetical protein [Candidatus Neomarinimicrobiota bacterium]|tara:strand:+ start:3301 stop:3966 length:666 start_codon:yes stop_codon:yes gene_type:complete
MDYIRYNQSLSITQKLIIINVLIYAVMYLFNLESFFIRNFSSIGVVSGTYNKFTGEVINQVTIFETNQYYRFLTANYLHGSLMHIMFNMMALYNLGELVESLIGRFRFFIIYTISGIGGALLSSIMNILLRPTEIVYSVGASGAVFGVAGSLVVLALYRKNKGMDLFYRINYQPLVFMLFLNLLMGQMVSRIDNWGHIGGLLVGCLIAYIYTFGHKALDNF